MIVWHGICIEKSGFKMQIGTFDIKFVRSEFHGSQYAVVVQLPNSIKDINKRHTHT